jgi:hypothetical protein
MYTRVTCVCQHQANIENRWQVEMKREEREEQV